MICNFVVAHLGRHRLLEDRECAAETAAFIRPARRHELDPSHLAQQIDRFREERLVDLRCLGGTQLAQSAAGIVQTDLVRKLRPGKGIDLEHVMQELNQLIGIAFDLLRLCGLRYGIQVLAHVVGTTARWSHDVLELLEVLHEQRLGPGRILLTTAVRHHLPAAGLVERIDDLDAEPLQQLKRCNADRREEGVDIAGNE
jgi:hypothetical protein